MQIDLRIELDVKEFCRLSSSWRIYVHILSALTCAESNFQLDYKSNGQLTIQHRRLNLDRFIPMLLLRLLLSFSHKILFLTQSAAHSLQNSIIMNGHGHSLKIILIIYSENWKPLSVCFACLQKKELKIKMWHTLTCSVFVSITFYYYYYFVYPLNSMNPSTSCSRYIGAANKQNWCGARVISTARAHIPLQCTFTAHTIRNS